MRTGLTFAAGTPADILNPNDEDQPRSIIFYGSTQPVPTSQNRSPSILVVFFDRSQ